MSRKEKWMTEIWSSISSIRLNDLVFVGTHNSAMNAKEAYKNAHFTQYCSYLEQFQKGVRYFDSRFAHISGQSAIRGHHAGIFTRANIKTQLKELADCITELRKGRFSDLVILEIHKLYNMNNKHLARDLISFFRNFIVKNNLGLKPTSRLREFEGKGNVILLWDHDGSLDSETSKYFWKRADDLVNNYPDRASVDGVFNRLNEVFKREKPKQNSKLFKQNDKFWISQAVSSTVDKYWTLYGAAKEANKRLRHKYISNWIRSNYGINVLLVDFYGVENDAESVQDYLIEWYRKKNNIQPIISYLLD